MSRNGKESPPRRTSLPLAYLSSIPAHSSHRKEYLFGAHKLCASSPHRSDPRLSRQSLLVELAETYHSPCSTLVSSGGRQPPYFLRKSRFLPQPAHRFWTRN